MSDLRIGIVGLGWVAGAHIETFKNVKGAKVTAVCSRRKLDPAELEKQYGMPLKVYNDYAEMLKDPNIDVIDICTPHPQHPAQAIRGGAGGQAPHHRKTARAGLQRFTQDARRDQESRRQHLCLF